MPTSFDLEVLRKTCVFTAEDTSRFWQMMTAQKPGSAHAGRASVDSIPNVQNQLQTKVYQLKFGFATISKHSTFLDIGSGVGLESLALQQLTGAKFHLLDGNSFDNVTEDYKNFSANYPVFNLRNCTTDIIQHSNMDINKFTFLNIDDPLTSTKYDFIMSNFAWCWHLPFNTYWDRVKNALKQDGTLSIDISAAALENEPNIIDIISDWFKVNPIVNDYVDAHTAQHHPGTSSNGTHGKWVMWRYVKPSV